MSAHPRLVALVFWLLTLAAGARGAGLAPTPATRGGEANVAHRERGQIVVTSHGWHTGLVLRRREVLRAGGCPALPEFAGEEFLEFGWGSEPFYTAPRPTLLIALRTVFTATPSVLHVVGFRGPPAGAFPRSEVVVLTVTEAGLRAICAEVGRTFARDAQGRALDRGPGLYGHSRFFAARGRYSLASNCNGWTARVLRAGGLPVRPGLSTLSAGGLMAQVRPLGLHRRVIHVGSSASGHVDQSRAVDRQGLRFDMHVPVIAKVQPTLVALIAGEPSR